MLGVVLALLLVAAAIALATVVAAVALTATTLASTPVVAAIRRLMWRDWHPPIRWIPDSLDETVTPQPARRHHEPVVLCSSSPRLGDLQMLVLEDGARPGEGKPGQATTAVLHARIEAGSDLELPGHAGFHLLIYVLAGRGSVCVEQLPICAGQLVLTDGATSVRVRAGPGRTGAGLDVLVLGELPVRQRLGWPGPVAVLGGPEVAQRLRELQIATGVQRRGLASRPTGRGIRKRTSRERSGVGASREQ